MFTIDGLVFFQHRSLIFFTNFDSSIEGVPVGGGRKGGIAAADFAVSDASATGVALTMKRPSEKLASFATLIVYSMSVDSPASGATPLGSSTPSGPAPTLNQAAKPKTYLAGSKALDSLAKLIQATESFFHPSNYGSWAPQLGRFLQTVTWEFHKRVKVSYSFFLSHTF